MALVPLNSDIRDGRTQGVSAANFTGRFFSTPVVNCNDPGLPPVDRLNFCLSDKRRGMLLSQDCPGGLCKVDQARDPFDMLTLDNTLSPEQKALLGCGPYFGTRCDNGERIQFVGSNGRNAEAGCDPQGVPVGGNRQVCDRPSHAVGDVDGAVERRFGQHDEEFVAAIAASHV